MLPWQRASPSDDAAARLRDLATAAIAVGPAAVAAEVADAARAAAFHAGRPGDATPIVVLIGGTGAGKSTLANRLLGARDRGDDAVLGTSFRRTFTAGVVAVSGSGDLVPSGWLGLPRRDADQLPARGDGEALTIVRHDGLPGVVLVDTPDVDGDVVEHHVRADRAFRWATAVLLVATPEKYQLPEIGRYAQLAARWGLPRRLVLNKADDLDAADDWQRQAGEAVVVVPRDDAALVAPAGRSLDDLKADLPSLAAPADAGGLRTRYRDVAGRAADAVLAPARERRRRADDAASRLRALVRPEAGVDVHPMTRHLQRRLRQQSVLYLMGPQRMLDRVRGVPAMVARLPRSTWDLISKGRLPESSEADAAPPDVAPDVTREAADAYATFAARCDDALRAAGVAGDGWRLPSDTATLAVQAEVDELRAWLEARWDKKPRDTRAIEWLAKHVPGGRHVAKLSESAPYLLIAASAATNVVLGPVDQVVIGGYLLTTWIGEKLSDEVAAKSREANAKIGQAFADACDRQVKHAVAWVQERAPDAKAIDALERATDGVAELSEASR